MTPLAVTTATRTARSLLWIVGGCFIVSGATGLIYEVLWMRMLGLVFGATTFATSTVLAAFMGGLALGSAWAGRHVSRWRRPLRAYGWLEIGIGCYALAVPFLFRAIDALYPALWARWQGSFYTFSLLRFLLACAALLLPTALMGATLPVLTAALARASGYLPEQVTRLYSFNLMGAIAGTLAAGFVLLPWLGVRGTIATAATLNLAIGIFALLLSRQENRSAKKEPVSGTGELLETASGIANSTTQDASSVKTAASFPPSPARLASPHRPSLTFWLIVAFVSGFVTISTQVVWTRLLALVIGSSTYAFSVVIALFLSGLTLAARAVGRQGRDLARAVLWVELATAASLCFSIVVTNRMPGLLVNAGLRLGLNSWGSLLALQVLVAALLVVLPAFLMGLVMPLVLLWAGTDTATTARNVGRCYAINTLGAIAGAFSAGFVLIPLTSTRFTLLMAAAACIGVAGYAYRPRSAQADVGLRRSLALCATVTLAGALFLITPYLNITELSIGAYDGLIRVLARSRFGGGDAEKQGSVTAYRLLDYKEGPTATVSVGEAGGVRFMSVNGRTNASDRDDMPTQIMVGQLPLLLAPRTEKNLVIGYASGVSVGAMLASDIPALECVELEPATVPLSSYFEHVNHKPLSDPRLRLIIDDARAYLRVTPARYDVIVSEPSHPWVPGVANLFTRDFFELGRARLAEGGVFAQWLQIYQLSPASLRSVLATFHQVFPHVMVFRVGGAGQGKDLIILGSARPLNLAQLDERLKNPRQATELARVQMDNRAAIESWFICDERRLGPAVAGAPINTDDNMLIEHRAPREAFKPLMEANSQWIEYLSR